MQCLITVDEGLNCVLLDSDGREDQDAGLQQVRGVKVAVLGSSRGSFSDAVLDSGKEGVMDWITMGECLV